MNLPTLKRVIVLIFCLTIFALICSFLCFVVGMHLHAFHIFPEWIFGSQGYWQFTVIGLVFSIIVALTIGAISMLWYKTYTASKWNFRTIILSFFLTILIGNGVVGGMLIVQGAWKALSR